MRTGYEKSQKPAKLTQKQLKEKRDKAKTKKGEHEAK